VSIKNPDKIHYLYDDEHYLCMRACGITPEKLTHNPRLVTCKNCLRKLEKLK